jgi:hypothetical protein
MNEQPPVKKPRGCFFYGCITAIALMLLMLGGLFLGYLSFRKMLINYTDTKPLPLPVVQMSPEAIKKLHERVDEFDKALKEHRPTPPLELSGDDINALIATSSGGQSWTGKVYVTIEGDRLTGQISVPTDAIRLGIFKGRYVNGSATFKVSLTSGLLHIKVPEITVKGRPLPTVYMDQIKQIDWAQNSTNDANTKSALERYEEIKIENGKLIIIPKKPETDTGPPQLEKTNETQTVK